MPDPLASAATRGAGSPESSGCGDHPCGTRTVPASPWRGAPGTLCSGHGLVLGPCRWGSHTAFLSSLLGWVLSDMQGCLLLPGCHDDKQCSSWTSSLLWPLASNYRAHSWSGQTRGNPSYPLGSRRKIQGYFLTVTRFLVGLTLTSFSVSSISESTYL